ncbi:FMN-binding protein [Clostridium felsineum]|uniref:FMN-binding protein n=1 Tax=Clostridium felsineum TaxID=36839 RepID=UPI00098BF8A8|nr:FMN-binding protein [Clostridium felsineum]URZ15172.1 hypothetical protein CLFE_011900 [Clostridium felsineum DSM 794]
MVRKIVLSVIGVVISIGIIVLARYFMSVNNYQSKVKDTKIENVNLQKVADGDYIGSYDVNFIEAKVSVKVRSHRIISIKLLKHKTERGKKAEVITDEVVKAQSLKVDTITGATNSSKVILKAIETALKSGEKV